LVSNGFSLLNSSTRDAGVKPLPVRAYLIDRLKYEIAKKKEELLAPKRADNLSGLSSDDCGEEALAESSTSDDWPVDARRFSCLQKR
jgi:hypothetical protein